jgi:NTP pyrophosphatase (non-canonical NTP hydrolase)
MADILIYLVQLADKMDVDLEEEIYRKLEKNGGSILYDEC